jgi:hypothetical protein
MAMINYFLITKEMGTDVGLIDDGRANAKV